MHHWQNTQLIHNDVTTPNSAGKTFIDLYNDAQGTSITEAEYVPAAYICLNTTETFLGDTITAYLPSMGQLRQMYNNIIDINTALSKIGANTISLGSGGWWSSTEYSLNRAWTLTNGNAYSGASKTDSRPVLPIFALE